MAILFISVLSDHRASLFLSPACEVLSPALLMVLGHSAALQGQKMLAGPGEFRGLSFIGRASGTVTNLKPNFLSQK